MVTILLQTIIDMLKTFFEGFVEWANDTGDKIAAIKTNTDELPGIKTDTADIVSNTAAVITPISNINTNVSAITPDVAAIKTDTAVIKNNANAIMTSSGQTAAYAEDIADNTLDCKNRLVTIGSDTTQIRADSGSLAADVSEIKNTLGLYLYNTIVTEDAEGSIANFDTDLKDYLQNAVVTIPADAGGISGLNIINCGFNLAKTDTLNTNWFLGNLNADGSISGNNICCYSALIKCKPNTQYCISIQENVLQRRIAWYDIDGNFIDRPNDATLGKKSVFTSPANAYYMKWSLNCGGSIFTNPLDQTQINIMKICLNESITAIDGTFESYNGNTQAVAFTTPITDGADVDLLSGIVKINTSPVTYDSITPIAIRTYKGVNNVYSDIGDMSVTYRETLKHYLEKQEGN